ncbi:13211_t:CDS:2, partial [Racocetra persica]
MKDGLWHLTVNNAIYNHEISEDMSGHLSNLSAISKDIYNTHDKIRHDNFQGHTPLQALFDELKEGNF